MRIGELNAKLYHAFLLGGSLVCALIYVMLNYESYTQFLFILAAPLIVNNVASVFKISDPKAIDPLLKKLAISTFVFTIIFGLGILIN